MVSTATGSTSGVSSTTASALDNAFDRMFATMEAGGMAFKILSSSISHFKHEKLGNSVCMCQFHRTIFGSHYSSKPAGNRS